MFIYEFVTSWFSLFCPIEFEIYSLMYFFPKICTFKRHVGLTIHYYKTLQVFLVGQCCVCCAGSG